MKREGVLTVHDSKQSTDRDNVMSRHVYQRLAEIPVLHNRDI